MGLYAPRPLHPIWPPAHPGLWPGYRTSGIASDRIGSMLRIGLTGGIACGKSEAARHFAEAGAPVIDADDIVHDLTTPEQPLLAAVVARAGPDVRRADGGLDRLALRTKIFQDAGLRRDIEALLHPPVREAIRDWFARQAYAYAVAVVPLLIEAGWHDDVDRILVVDCPQAMQRTRLLQRPDMDAAQADAILQAQATSTQRRQYAHDVIDNSGRLHDLGGAIRELHHTYAHA